MVLQRLPLLDPLPAVSALELRLPVHHRVAVQHVLAAELLLADLALVAVVCAVVDVAVLQQAVLVLELGAALLANALCGNAQVLHLQKEQLSPSINHFDNNAIPVSRH